MNRIEKIRAKRQALDAQAKSEQERKEQTVKFYTNRLKQLAPRINELMRLAGELLKNDIPLGRRQEQHFGYQDEFVTEGIYHRLGFYIKYKDGYNYLIGIGIEGGGCCGNDLVVDNNGTITENPIDEKHARWYYNKAYEDFCHKCQEFLGGFDKFEKKVFDYVDNL